MTRQEVVAMLAAPAPELFGRACAIRSACVGDGIHIRAIIEYSNYCGCDCHYCGLRAGHAALARYRMTPERVEAVARSAVEAGIRTIVLQGGEDPGVPADDICRMIAGVKSLGDVAVTVSAGRFARTEYARMLAAGADRYLIKFETSDPALYARLHEGAPLAERLECIRDLKDLGFQTGSGSLIGLPGQTVESLADDLLLAAELDLDMATFSPFIPHPATPLGGALAGSADMALRVLAAARVLLPSAHIPTSTALASISPDGHASGLRAGANVVMVDVTPLELAAHYDLYPGKAPTAREPVAALRSLLAKLSLRQAEGRGDSLKRMTT